MSTEPRQKTPGKTPVPKPGNLPMRPQAHGGSLRTGGFHGPGPGRPRSIFLEGVVTTVAEKTALLGRVVRGEPIDVTERDSNGVTRTRWRTPTAMERIRAVEVLAKMAGIWR